MIKRDPAARMPRIRSELRTDEMRDIIGLFAGPGRINVDENYVLNTFVHHPELARHRVVQVHEVGGADHPAVLVGGDNGPTPVEFLLHARVDLRLQLEDIEFLREVDAQLLEAFARRELDVTAAMKIPMRPTGSSCSTKRGTM